MPTMLRPVGGRHRALTRCPVCGHDDYASRSLLATCVQIASGPRPCCYAVGDEISPLRAELCGCTDPVHSGLAGRGFVRGEQVRW